MYFVFAIGLLAATVATTPAPQLMDPTPGYLKGKSHPARFRYYENQDFLQGPCDITTGPHVYVNFLNNIISNFEIGSLTNFDYATETFDGVYLPPTPLSGNVWLTEMLGQAIIKFDVKTKQFTLYPLLLNGPGMVVVHNETENSYIWFAGFIPNSNVRFDTRTEKIDVFTDPLSASFPTENTVDGQGRYWYSTATRNSTQYVALTWTASHKRTWRTQ